MHHSILKWKPNGNKIEMEKVDIQNRRTAWSKTFRVVISKMEDGSYMANVPVLEHCFSFGETIDAVIVNVQEALEGVLETMEANGWPIPTKRFSLY